MKQGEVIKAYRALDSLMTVQMPVVVAYKLYKLKKALQTVWDFQVSREKALIDEYHVTILQNGDFKFEDSDSMTKWSTAMSELSETEINDLQFEPVKLPNDLDITVKPEILANLEGFVFLDV